MVERTFGHEVTYTNAGAIPVADVAASLVANEKLVREAVCLLEDLFPGLKIEGVEVNFSSATTNSPLKEIMAGAIFLSYQKDLEVGVPFLIENLTGLDIPPQLEGLVTALVFVVAVYGISKAMEIFGPSRKVSTTLSSVSPLVFSDPPVSGEPNQRVSSEPPVIQGNYNTILNIAGDLINVDPDQLTDALDKRYSAPKTRRALARRSLEFIRPAQREAGAEIVGAGFKLEAETIAAAPDALDLEDEDETADAFDARRVVVHATDLDSNKSGWAGHLPGLHEKRLRMLLAPTVKRDEVWGKKEIVADIVLMSKPGVDGDPKPYLFHVMKVHPQSE